MVGNRAEVTRTRGSIFASLSLHAIEANYLRDRPVDRVVYDCLTRAGQGHTAGQMWPAGRTLPRSDLKIVKGKTP